MPTSQLVRSRRSRDLLAPNSGIQDTDSQGPTPDSSLEFSSSEVPTTSSDVEAVQDEAVQDEAVQDEAVQEEAPVRRMYQVGPKDTLFDIAHTELGDGDLYKALGRVNGLDHPYYELDGVKEIELRTEGPPNPAPRTKVIEKDAFEADASEDLGEVTAWDGATNQAAGAAAGKLFTEDAGKANLQLKFKVPVDDQGTVMAEFTLNSTLSRADAKADIVSSMHIKGRVNAKSDNLAALQATRAFGGPTLDLKLDGKATDPTTLFNEAQAAVQDQINGDAVAGALFSGKPLQLEEGKARTRIKDDKKAVVSSGGSEDSPTT